MGGEVNSIIFIVQSTMEQLEKKIDVQILEKIFEGSMADL
jgi:hypothetical protein